VFGHECRQRPARTPAGRARAPRHRGARASPRR
jgi:hypothetical protein